IGSSPPEARGAQDAQASPAPKAERLMAESVMYFASSGSAAPACGPSPGRMASLSCAGSAVPAVEPAQSRIAQWQYTTDRPACALRAPLCGNCTDTLHQL